MTAKLKHFHVKFQFFTIKCALSISELLFVCLCFQVSVLPCGAQKFTALTEYLQLQKMCWNEEVKGPLKQGPPLTTQLCQVNNDWIIRCPGKKVPCLSEMVAVKIPFCNLYAGSMSRAQDSNRCVFI